MLDAEGKKHHLSNERKVAEKDLTLKHHLSNNSNNNDNNKRNGGGSNREHRDDVVRSVDLSATPAAAKVVANSVVCSTNDERHYRVDKVKTLFRG